VRSRAPYRLALDAQGPLPRAAPPGEATEAFTNCRPSAEGGGRWEPLAGARTVSAALDQLRAPAGIKLEFFEVEAQAPPASTLPEARDGNGPSCNCTGASCASDLAGTAHQNSRDSNREAKAYATVVLLWNRVSSRKSSVNNSGYLCRLFHSRTKSASLDSHMYVSGWLLCCHQPKYLQDPLHHILSWPDQDDIFRQDLIHCSGS